MRLGPSGQLAYISLIRSRRRLIFRCAPSPSETLMTNKDRADPPKNSVDGRSFHIS